ncbi:MAG: glutamyl-tRNA reductase [Flavipsychrobacter sp.]
MYHKDKDISDFRVVGINYKKTDAGLRGQFAINNDQYAQILATAPAKGMKAFFILSTCNRTEIYGLAEDATQLMELICSQAEGDIDTFSKIAYIKNGWDAVEHLFQVSSGLDSQILGDYEILGQIKNSVKFAKENGFICPFMERLINCVLQSSKAIKTNTELSGGTVSVSFAAVQYIKEHISSITDKKILLLGIGKIGRNTCKNLVDYLETTNITLVNRTEEKAATLAKELKLQSAPITEINEQIATSDIILVATNSPEPTILKSQLEGKGEKLIIDLSVPCNVEEAARQMEGITFINVDELSKIKNQTLQARKAEVPKALAIIQEHIAEFREWYDMRKHVPMLKEVKYKLQEISTKHIQLPASSEEKIQKVINTLAIKVRSNNTIGCNYIEAINEYIA